MTAGAIGVLLVDDHAVVREGYRRLLERSGSVRVLGEAADAASAYARFCELQPQVVVMDIAMPGVSGIEIMRRMRARDPSSKVLIFSMYEDPIYATRALEAGASGYVTKASAPEVLVEAVRRVAAGARYLSAQIEQAMALTTQPAALADALSPREFEVLRLIVQGRSLRDIALRLGLTSKTVANHQSAIRQKLGAESAVQLLQIAARLGITPPQA